MDITVNNSVPDAVTRLIDQLSHDDLEIRRYAARSLGMRGDARAIAPLQSALSDPDAEVRRYAIDSLGRMGDPALDTLVMALQHEDNAVRQHTAIALSRQGNPQTVQFILEAYAAETDSHARGFMIFALGEIGGEESIPVLVEALQDADALVCRYAIDALARVGDARVLPAFKALLWDEDINIAILVVDALLGIDDPDAFNEVMAALGRDDASLRKHIVTQFGTLGAGERVMPALMNTLQTDADIGVRAAAAAALGKRNAVNAIPILSDLLQHDDKLLARRAALALKSLDSPEAKAIFERWKATQ